jgi:hypothetical protein
MCVLALFNWKVERVWQVLEKPQSSFDVEDDFDSLLLLSLEAGFSVLLSLLDFSLLVERPCPEGER